ncbi:MAG: hypothetical protein LBI53_02100 [Candidatus Peribacteria bacterium]|nr:hypothetical protein [Candidatus Peribacteria bacterium]
MSPFSSINGVVNGKDGVAVEDDTAVEDNTAVEDQLKIKIGEYHQAVQNLQNQEQILGEIIARNKESSKSSDEPPVEDPITDGNVEIVAPGGNGPISANDLFVSNSTSTTPETTQSNSSTETSGSREKEQFVFDKHESVNYADIEKLPDREKQLLKRLIGKSKK